MRLTVDAIEPERDALVEAARVIAQHGVVAFPTETFYGLAVSVFDRQGCDRVLDIKNRPADKALPCIVSDFDALELVVSELPDRAVELASRFWPGPLTMVLPAKPTVAASADGTIAVRVSSLPLARALAAAAGPITSTSANPSGAPPAATADEVASLLGDAVELVLDGGTTLGGLPSTIVAVRPGAGSNAGVELIREGAIPFRDVIAERRPG